MSQPNPTEAALQVLGKLHKISRGELETLLNRKMPVPATNTDCTSGLLRQTNRNDQYSVSVLGLINSILEMSGNPRIVRVTEDDMVLGYVAHPVAKPVNPTTPAV